MHGDKGEKDLCWRFFSKYVKCGVQRTLIIRFVEVQFSLKEKKAGKDTLQVIHAGRILRIRFLEEAPPALNVHLRRQTFCDPSSDISATFTPTATHTQDLPHIWKKNVIYKI